MGVSGVVSPLYVWNWTLRSSQVGCLGVMSLYEWFAQKTNEERFQAVCVQLDVGHRAQ